MYHRNSQASFFITKLTKIDYKSSQAVPADYCALKKFGARVDALGHSASEFTGLGVVPAD